MRVLVLPSAEACTDSRRIGAKAGNRHCLSVWSCHSPYAAGKDGLEKLVDRISTGCPSGCVAEGTGASKPGGDACQERLDGNASASCAMDRQPPSSSDRLHRVFAPAFSSCFLGFHRTLVRKGIGERSPPPQCLMLPLCSSPKRAGFHFRMPARWGRLQIGSSFRSPPQREREAYLPWAARGRCAAQGGGMVHTRRFAPDGQAYTFDEFVRYFGEPWATVEWYSAEEEPRTPTEVPAAATQGTKTEIPASVGAPQTGGAHARAAPAVGAPQPAGAWAATPPTEQTPAPAPAARPIGGGPGQGPNGGPTCGPRRVSS